ncbi:C39 family peptidase [Aneurinibacillus aneurinilyticus]|uniref:C39 family peptidase n=1 Tax=Aneurinibacillus aneurinilyticus TaxID=1391 RepID=UPI002E22979B|nr:C39 family peptidase [Aneurinibacillus aneurinilyticus]
MRRKIVFSLLSICVVILVFIAGTKILTGKSMLSMPASANKQEKTASQSSSAHSFEKHLADFAVYQKGTLLSDFDTFAEAASYAKKYKESYIQFGPTGVPIWENKVLPAEADLIDAPLISQLPELPRGCEVTSLAMLLQFANIDVGKMELADEVKKDSTSYYEKDDVIYFGNPYDGFVGDMYTFTNPGLGVYHGPIKDLAKRYLPDQVIDMTGSDFQDVLHSLSRGTPVWVISTSRFSRLPDSLFETWQTPTGPVTITYKEHSVLLTGYDEKYVYFNDPLANKKNRKMPIHSFQEAWEQMGKQAITLAEKQKS